MYLVPQVLSRLSDWLLPLHELPKTPELVEEKLADISQHSKQLFLTAEECLGRHNVTYM